MLEFTMKMEYIAYHITLTRKEIPHVSVIEQIVKSTFC